MMDSQNNNNSNCAEAMQRRYQEILREILEELEGNKNDDSAAAASSNLQAQQQQKLQFILDQNVEKFTADNLSFSPVVLTDSLARKLLLVAVSPPETTTTQNNDDTKTFTLSPSQALQISKTLVESFPETYLPALASSVSDLVRITSNSSSYNNDIKLSDPSSTPGLLQLWIKLIARAPLEIHEKLANALLTVLSYNNNNNTSSCIHDAAQYLAEEWKLLLQDKTKSNEAVRCAIFGIQWISKLEAIREAEQAGITNLYVQMLGNFDDPLLQLSLLDATIIEFEPTTNSTNNSVQEWMASPPIMSLILQFLKDPFLSEAALRYVGVLSILKPSELDTIVDHVISLVAHTNIPTRDTERLPLVHAISTIATASPKGLAIVLTNAKLRNAWWNIDRISQPKLKAAILVSVAMALPIIEKQNSNSSAALQLYKTLGDDNTAYTTTTTQWLLTKHVPSPLVEVRIGALALLAACLRLHNNAAGQIIGVLDYEAHNLLVDYLLSPSREPTRDARMAKFDLLEAVWEAIQQQPSLEERPKLLKDLQSKLAMGPHGQMHRQRHEEELETG